MMMKGGVLYFDMKMKFLKVGSSSGLLGKKEKKNHRSMLFPIPFPFKTRETIREKSRVKQIFWKVGTHMPMDIHYFSS